MGLYGGEGVLVFVNYGRKNESFILAFGMG